eukprot:3494676-Pleurochrysis_carterae.AAC.3
MEDINQTKPLKLQRRCGADDVYKEQLGIYSCESAIFRYKRVICFNANRVRYKPETYKQVQQESQHFCHVMAYQSSNATPHQQISQMQIL